MRGLTPAQKRQYAQTFLTFLKERRIKEWEHTYTMLLYASERTGIAVYDLWKVIDLLLTLGRIERISPNGKKGCRVLSYASLTKPVPSDAIICCRANCPIWKHLSEIIK